LGAHDVARDHAAAALRLAPDDPRLVANAQFMGVDQAAPPARRTARE
jgi:hypothetical protein